MIRLSRTVLNFSKVLNLAGQNQDFSGSFLQKMLREGPNLVSSAKDQCSGIVRSGMWRWSSDLALTSDPHWPPQHHHYSTKAPGAQAQLSRGIDCWIPHSALSPLVETEACSCCVMSGRTFGRCHPTMWGARWLQVPMAMAR